MAGWEPVFAFALLGVVFVGLVLDFAPDVLLISGVVICGVTGIISPKEAFQGFANEGMLTVAALYIVAAALRETGALSIVGRLLLGRVHTERGVLGRMGVMVTSSSAFLNNTPIVAMFLPVITDWCKNNKVSPSRLLLPLSYLSILGGICTLIGTSTNLVVAGLMSEKFKQDPQRFALLAPPGLFELSPVGIPLAIVGVVYLLTLGRRLLPNREGTQDSLQENPREYLVNMRVEAGCRLIGKSVEKAGLRHLPGLFLVEISRGVQLITPVAPDQILQEGDILTFTGAVETIVDLHRIAGLELIRDSELDPKVIARRETMLAEAVVSNRSPVLGKTIRDSDFRALYNAAVIAVHRGETRLKGRVGDMVLHGGDTLLLQAGPHFVRAHRNNPDFYLVRGVEDSHPFRHDKAVAAIGVLGVLIFLMGTEVVPIVIAAFLAAGLMVALGCISLADARKSLDIPTLACIGASFGFGEALVKAGCVDIVADTFIRPIIHSSPMILMAGVYIITVIITELLTNNAAAALMFPFAVEFASTMGVSPRPLCMTVMFAASIGFVSPMGYQTHLMVFSPGGYRLSDFVRVGLPLHILLFPIAMWLIPWWWAF